MRVLLTTDTVGGVWTYAVELGRALGRRGVEVVLAAAGPPLEDDRREEARRAGLPLFEREAALEWMDEPWDDVARTGEWLLGLAADAQPDVVHLNEYAHGALDWPAPVLVVGHSCVLSWTEAVRGSAEPLSHRRYQRTVERGLAGADLLVAPTRWMLAELERLYRPRCDRLVIANGRDPRLFQPREKEPFVLTGGRLWDEGKNVAALDRASRRLEWPVFATGDAGGWRPRSVRWVGHLDTEALATWMGRASIFALPARYEPFGLTPLEAALSGCALVLGDVPSLHEVWADSAVYVARDDEDAILAALERLIADDGLRMRYAAAAQRRAARYAPERMADEYLSVYRRLRARERIAALH